MRTTTLSCPEHTDCVVQLVKDDDVAPEDVLVPPTWAFAWSSQTEGTLVRIDHVDALRHPDGLLMGSDALLEARVRRLERRRWWRRKR